MQMQAIADQLWIARFPLRLAGCEIGRTVSVIRLATGELVVHSTAPFEPAHVGAIETLGRPRWLVEATLLHDTYAAQGRRTFPSLPYLAPPGFPDSLESTPLDPAPAAWGDELEVYPLAGMPKVREHLLFHRPSGSLIVADLFFNLVPGTWERLFFRTVAGIREFPAMSRLFRLMIRDRAAFRRSLEPVRDLPIERIIVAHGEPVLVDARAALERVLTRHGF